ncbi:MAG: hypothetical protein ABR898_11400 [Terracidiphilus sp.]|jgi:hypothetical protein
MPATNPNPVQPNDGTRQLLQWGASILGSGIVAGLLLVTVLGGFSPTGASTNTGWFALIVALMCIPFGGLLLALGVAKWFRNRALSRHR